MVSPSTSQRCPKQRKTHSGPESILINEVPVIDRGIVEFLQQLSIEVLKAGGRGVGFVREADVAAFALVGFRPDVRK